MASVLAIFHPQTMERIETSRVVDNSEGGRKMMVGGERITTEVKIRTKKITTIEEEGDQRNKTFRINSLSLQPEEN